MVRILVEDDPDQAITAHDVLARGFIVTTSVLLETEWLLRSKYSWPRATIAAALRDILDMPSLRSAPDNILWAIDRFAAGADFADMVHLVTANSASGFATFDRRLAKQAGAGSPLSIETLT